MNIEKIKHLLVLVIGVAVILIGGEILLLGKSSIPSAGWHLSSTSTVGHSYPRSYPGLKRLNGVWFLAVGGLFCFLAGRALRQK